MAVSLSKGVYIVAAKRTPFGRLGGMYRECPAEQLFAAAASAALQAGNLSPHIIDTVNIGQISSMSITSMSARHAALKAGIPKDKPVLSVNKASGSSFESAIISAQEIVIGSADVTLAGGMENLSSIPLLVRGARFGIPLGGSKVQVEDMLDVSNYDFYSNKRLIQLSDLIAEKYQLSRKEVDEVALTSQRRWKAAHDAGIFETELAPVPVESRGVKRTLTTDEFPRPNTTIDSLSSLPPLFPGGVTTVGNSSGLNDGAGALILASSEAMSRHGLLPLARVAGWARAACSPHLMATALVPAVQRLLATAGLTTDDINIFEIHETFAAQALACTRLLKLEWSKTNLCGGALAIGHPSGASGARLLAHLTHELRRRKLKRGVASVCIAGGQGVAILIEAV